MANVGNAAAGQVLQGTGINSGPTYESLGVNSGLQNHGTVISQGNAAFVSINPGTAGQVLTSNGNAVDPSFQNASSGGFNWSNEVIDKTMAINTGYTSSSLGGQLLLTLPATAAYGSIIRVAGNTVAGWRIVQNGGQTIHYGNINTTTGAGGFLESTGQYDAVELLCSIANTDFTVLSVVGNITYN